VSIDKTGDNRLVSYIDGSGFFAVIGAHLLGRADRHQFAMSYGYRLDVWLCRIKGHYVAVH
jgi:hypothetical protein